MHRKSFYLAVCSCHVACAFRGGSALYGCLGVKGLLAQVRRTDGCSEHGAVVVKSIILLVSFSDTLLVVSILDMIVAAFAVLKGSMHSVTQTLRAFRALRHLGTWVFHLEALDLVDPENLHLI